MPKHLDAWAFDGIPTDAVEARLLTSSLTAGRSGSVGAGSFAVDCPGGMSVRVSAGQYLLALTAAFQGTVHLVMDTPETLGVDPTGTNQYRRDIVITEVTTSTSPWVWQNRVVKGTPAATAGNAVAPSVPTNASLLEEILLPPLTTGAVTASMLASPSKRRVLGTRGPVPVANQAERDTLVTIGVVFPGFQVWRMDAKALDTWDGTGWSRTQRGANWYPLGMNLGGDGHAAADSLATFSVVNGWCTASGRLGVDLGGSSAYPIVFILPVPPLAGSVGPGGTDGLDLTVGGTDIGSYRFRPAVPTVPGDSVYGPITAGLFGGAFVGYAFRPNTTDALVVRPAVGDRYAFSLSYPVA